MQMACFEVLGACFVLVSMCMCMHVSTQVGVVHLCTRVQIRMCRVVCLCGPCIQCLHVCMCVYLCVHTCANRAHYFLLKDGGLNISFSHLCSL